MCATNAKNTNKMNLVDFERAMSKKDVVHYKMANACAHIVFKVQRIENRKIRRMMLEQYSYILNVMYATSRR